MGKLNEFSIFLNNPQQVYYSGQQIDGTVVVDLNEAMKLRCVSLRFEGKANVHWTEQHTTGSGKSRRTETRHYYAHEDYFNFDLMLFGSGQSTLLQAGRRTFPFSFFLPPNLPSSFEGAFGNVRYSLKGKIDRPWKFDHKTKKLFAVVSVLDLNEQTMAMSPAEGGNEKNLCCLCCKSGPISATFRIDRQGFVPGETIQLSAEICNHSSRKMKASRVRLIMYIMYHAIQKKRSVQQDVAVASHQAILPGDSDIWNREPLHVPPIPPSYLVGCSIIDIKYVLQLEVDPAGPAFDLEVPLELIIGTIPLRQVVQQQYGVNLGPFSAVQPSNLGPFSAVQPSNLGPFSAVQPLAPAVSQPPQYVMAPPSYAECVFGKSSVLEEDDNEHTGGDKNFTPSYAYYEWAK
ncbi:arrestin domain-containing protein 3-like isoform X2 [Dreissena polymorpha]|uniref:arrestin domain-containing protein 3-like isoform X2 n=1 Tax=Dreissena polymorpha TaxID=45954 RepID=UPI00226523D5|nr:arrestin domain-containing protein 3-like isoform X2 [Dreissena polymorpha]